MGDCACHVDPLYPRGDGERLAFAVLELTPLCNNRCIGCCNVFRPHFAPPPLTGQEWIGLIARMVSSVMGFKLSGGEPTLHPDFPEIVSFVHALGFPIRLLTNGRWSEPGRVLALLQPIGPAVTLLISLHGPDAPSHESFSGVPGSFSEAVTSIRQAAEKGLRVAVSTVITRYNWNRVEEMVAFVQSLGATHTVFNRYIGRPLPALEASPAQMAQAAQRVGMLIARGESVRWGTPLPFCRPSQTAGSCQAGEGFVTVDPWGNVRPCNHAPYIVGNLCIQPFEEIWRSSKIEAWRSMMPPECTDCAVYRNCHGGCRAEALLRSPSSYPLPRKPYRGEQITPDVSHQFLI